MYRLLLLATFEHAEGVRNPRVSALRYRTDARLVGIYDLVLPSSLLTVHQDGL